MKSVLIALALLVVFVSAAPSTSAAVNTDRLLSICSAAAVMGGLQGMSHADCVVRASMVAAYASHMNVTQGMSLLLKTYGAGAALQSEPSNALQQSGNCAQDSGSCDCTGFSEITCTVKTASCAAACIGTGGAGCVPCLLALTGCLPCACYMVCNTIGTGEIATAVCPSTHANCAS